MQDKHCFVLLFAGLLVGSVPAAHGEWVNFAGDDFETGAPGWSMAARTNEAACGWGWILGGCNTFGLVPAVVRNSSTEKTYGSLPPHTSVRVRFDWCRIDSWEGEPAQLFANGNLVWEESLSYGDGTDCACQTTSGWDDNKYSREVIFDSTSESVILRFTARLDETYDNESWGLDNVSVDVRTGDEEWLNVGSDDFETGALGWSDARRTEEAGCGWGWILGGCNTFGVPVLPAPPDTSTAKTYSSLPPHTKLRARFDWCRIDSWEGEPARLYADGNLVWEEHMSYGDGTDCACDTASGYDDNKYSREVVFDHIGDSVTLRFTAQLDETYDNESWGLDNVFLDVWPDTHVESREGGANYAAYAETGVWQDSQAKSTAEGVTAGIGSRKASTDTAGRAARFSLPEAALPGMYEIYLCWAAGSHRAHAIPVRLDYDTGESAGEFFTIGNGWNQVGTESVQLSPGRYVELSTTGAQPVDANHYVLADAAWFRRTGPAQFETKTPSPIATTTPTDTPAATANALGLRRSGWEQLP